LKQALAFLLFGALMTWSPAAADTPDGQTPSEETVCDQERGAAYGLCTAYCEAMDCDSEAPQASATGCSRVRANFERITGRPLPCDIACPCGLQLPLFAELGEGTVPVEGCIADDQVISVVTESDTFAIVNNAVQPAYCSVNNEPPFVELTPGEVVACRDFLRRAVAAQGVVCEQPE
jgi:hypothetical protein